MNRKNLLLPLAIFLVALALRLFALGKAELWMDEMLFASLSSPDYTTAQVFAQHWDSVITSMAWLPLPAMVENFFLHLSAAPSQEVVANSFLVRLPGAVLGALAPLLMFLAVRRILDKRTALLTALWMLGTFYFVFYSREAHAYPLLLCLASLFALLVARVLTGGRPLADAALLLPSTVLFLYTHLTVPFAVAATAVAALGFSIHAFRAKNADAARRFLLVAAACAVAFAAFAPVVLKLLHNKTPHMGSGNIMAPWMMLHDFLTKTCLGERIVGGLAAWALLVAGIRQIYTRGRGYVPAFFLAVFALSLLAITIGATMTQYLSSRYFAAAAPLLAMVYAAGIVAAAGAIVRVVPGADENRAALTLAGLILAVHFVLFLPRMYALVAKSQDYGSIVRWLLKNVPDGGAYLPESAYDVRFLGGYHPTPRRVCATPYVHGSGDAEVARLHERQKNFMIRFPEVPFIENHHHGLPDPSKIWTFPKQFFRRTDILVNKPLRALTSLGIYPTHPFARVDDYYMTTYIFYNGGEADARAAVQAQGRLVLARWEGSGIMPISRDPRGDTEYARTVPGSRARASVDNLHGQDLRGTLGLVLGVAGVSGPQEIVVRLSGGREQKATVQGGQLSSVRLEGVTIPKDGSVLDVELAPGSAQGRGIMVYDVDFMEAPVGQPTP
jgi:hypothetical protein